MRGERLAKGTHFLFCGSLIYLALVLACFYSPPRGAKAQGGGSSIKFRGASVHSSWAAWRSAHMGPREALKGPGGPMVGPRRPRETNKSLAHRAQPTKPREAHKDPAHQGPGESPSGPIGNAQRVRMGSPESLKCTLCVWEVGRGMPHIKGGGISDTTSPAWPQKIEDQFVCL